MFRMQNSNPGLLGFRSPVTRGRSAQYAVPIAPPVGFACEFPGCSGSFDTKTGRGLHHRCAHPDWYDQQQNTVKARWNDEEIRLLARKEVELTREGERFMNQALVSAFPERTLEAIKDKRKQAAYKRFVREFLEEAFGGLSEEAQDHIEMEDDGYRAIADFIQTLPMPQDEDYDTSRLIRICRSLANRTSHDPCYG